MARKPVDDCMKVIAFLSGGDARAEEEQLGGRISPAAPPASW